MGRAKVARRAPDCPKCSKKHASQLPFSCLKLRFSGKYLLSTGLWSVHSEYFPEKIKAPPEVAPWIFPLNCCPSLHARQWGTKSKWKNIEVTNHDWGMILTSEISETCYGIYEVWPWTNRTKEIKRKLRNRYFFQRWWLTERRPTPKDYIAHNVNLLHPLS